MAGATASSSLLRKSSGGGRTAPFKRWGSGVAAGISHNAGQGPPKRNLANSSRKSCSSAGGFEQRFLVGRSPVFGGLHCSYGTFIQGYCLGVTELGVTLRGLAMTEPLFQPHSEGTLHQPSGQKVEEE